MNLSLLFKKKLDIKKLFVWIPNNVAFDGASVSAANPSKIYFDSALGKIWVQGVAFG